MSGEGDDGQQKPLKQGDVPYEVGFGKPPKHSRFKPGQSGNPGGRPRRRKEVNLRAELQEVLATSVKLRKNGKFVRQSIARTIFDQLAAGAVRGDPKCIRELLRYMKEFGVAPIEPTSNYSWSPDAAAKVRKKLDDIARRMHEGEEANLDGDDRDA